jgi:ubiquitin-conjugating enzyme E2 J2
MGAKAVKPAPEDIKPEELGLAASTPVSNLIAPTGPMKLVPDNKSEAEEKPLGVAASWGRLLWEKWRWGALIAFAVMVSRMSSA